MTTAVIPSAYDYGTSIPGVMGETMSDEDGVFCFACPACESQIASRQELLGTRMMCPECNEIIYVPSQTAPLESGTGICNSKPVKGESTFLEMLVAGILLLLFLEFIGC